MKTSVLQDLIASRGIVNWATIGSTMPRDACDLYGLGLPEAFFKLTEPGQVLIVNYEAMMVGNGKAGQLVIERGYGGTDPEVHSTGSTVHVLGKNGDGNGRVKW